MWLRGTGGVRGFVDFIIFRSHMRERVKQSSRVGVWVDESADVVVHPFLFHRDGVPDEHITT